jgi:hypothetical protein
LSGSTAFKATVKTEASRRKDVVKESCSPNGSQEDEREKQREREKERAPGRIPE